jgi:hypothetical protein
VPQWLYAHAGKRSERIAICKADMVEIEQRNASLEVG